MIFYYNLKHILKINNILLIPHTYVYHKLYIIRILVVQKSIKLNKNNNFGKYGTVSISSKHNRY